MGYLYPKLNRVKYKDSLKKKRKKEIEKQQMGRKKESLKLQKRKNAVKGNRGIDRKKKG